MNTQHLDEQAIFEVAREIQNAAVRAKYLSQVCHDERLLGRLEGRLMTARRRWQFSLRKLMVVMVLVGCLLGGMGVLTRQAIRARQAESEARLQAERARYMAVQAEAALQQAAARQSAEEADRE